MTIMKIIDGLYFTIGMILFNPLTGESKTPDQLNEDDRTTYDACMGAIALLKAQEPRVMTLEEVKEAAGHDVWLELSGNIADDVLLAATIEGCGTKGLCTRYESLNYSAYGIRPYGWRCWTSRPDQATREATPWN